MHREVKDYNMIPRTRAKKLHNAKPNMFALTINLEYYVLIRMHYKKTTSCKKVVGPDDSKGSKVRFSFCC